MHFSEGKLLLMGSSHSQLTQFCFDLNKNIMVTTFALRLSDWLLVGFHRRAPTQCSPKPKKCYHILLVQCN